MYSTVSIKIATFIASDVCRCRWTSTNVPRRIATELGRSQEIASHLICHTTPLTVRYEYGPCCFSETLLNGGKKRPSYGTALRSLYSARSANATLTSHSTPAILLPAISISYTLYGCCCRSRGELCSVCTCTVSTLCTQFTGRPRSGRQIETSRRASSTVGQDRVGCNPRHFAHHRCCAVLCCAGVQYSTGPSSPHLTTTGLDAELELTCELGIAQQKPSIQQTPPSPESSSKQQIANSKHNERGSGGTNDGPGQNPAHLLPFPPRPFPTLPYLSIHLSNHPSIHPPIHRSCKGMQATLCLVLSHSVGLVPSAAKLPSARGIHLFRVGHLGCASWAGRAGRLGGLGGF